MENKIPYIPSEREVEEAEKSMDELQEVMTDVRHEMLTNPEFEGKKIVFIMRGIPGSGKSTVAKEIAHPDGVIHSTDRYFYDADGKYQFDGGKIKENHDKNFLSFCESLKSDKAIVVVDNSNIRRWEFQRYVDAAKEAGYAVREVDMPMPDPAQASERNAHGGSSESTKARLLKDIQLMREQYEK